MRMTQDMEDDEKGKLFVGGLSWETTQENLQRYFSHFGDVIDCVVMKNNESGRSRGFGFVTFADPNNVGNVLQSGPHALDGRTIDPKPCNPRTLQKPKKGGGYPKVFLGGLPSNVTETDLRAFFGRYGKVMEVVIMYDQEKKKSRGFGFLSFEDDASVDRVTSEHYINLHGKQVEIKKAEPRDGSSGNKMGVDANQWNHPQGAPLGMMAGPNGQMGGPPMSMATMGAPNMMQGYQGWGTSQQQGYGYGTPNAPNSYQGWGAPPGPQGPPPQWSNYATAQQSQGYGGYEMYNSTTGPSGASGGANWNTWNMPQNSAGTGGSGGEMYSRGQASGGGGRCSSQTAASGSCDTNTGGGIGASGGGATGSNNPASKSGSDYGGGYGSSGYGNYSTEQSSSYGSRPAYASESTTHQSYSTNQPQAKGF